LAKGSPGIKAVSLEMSGVLNRLGGNIKRARMRRGIKQGDLAERVSISRPTLRKLERGDPTVSLAVLVQVLDVLGWRASFIILPIRTRMFWVKRWRRPECRKSEWTVLAARTILISEEYFFSMNYYRLSHGGGCLSFIVLDPSHECLRYVVFSGKNGHGI